MSGRPRPSLRRTSSLAPADRQCLPGDQVRISPDRVLHVLFHVLFHVLRVPFRFLTY